MGMVARGWWLVVGGQWLAGGGVVTLRTAHLQVLAAGPLHMTQDPARLPLGQVLPALATEIEELLRNEGEFDRASQVARASLVDGVCAPANVLLSNLGTSPRRRLLRGCRRRDRQERPPRTALMPGLRGSDSQ